MSYRVLPAAQQDFEAIDDWVFEQFGSDFADKTQSKLYEVFNLLTSFPLTGETSQPVRFFQSKRYWIVYQPGNPLLIHRVYHAARDLDRISLR